MADLNPAPNRSPNVLMRHKVLTGIAALVLVGVVINDGNAEPDTNEASDTPSASASDTTSPKTSNATDQPSAKADDQPTHKRTKAAAKQVATTPTPRPAKQRHRRTYLVTRVIDGDTIELSNNESVRVVGIDTPERGECGFDEAAVNMERLVLGKRVRLTVTDEDRDHYGRLLRYVDVGGIDAGLRQIDAALAMARYDSRDGYGYHARENRYIAADHATPNRACRMPKPAPVMKQPAAPKPGPGCEPGYDPCVPPYPPDLDCADVDGPIRVTGSDPHGLDGEGDGIACE